MSAGATAEAGLSAQPDSGVYVEDAYFTLQESHRDRTLVELDFTQFNHRQESVVTKHIADSLAPTTWDPLKVLVLDGGEVSPKEIAEETDRHPGSTRRALKRIPELVEHEYGSVSLRLKYIADLVHDVVKEAKEAARRIAEAGAKAIEAPERGLDESTSAFIAWVTKHDIEVRNLEADSLRLEFGPVDDIRKKLREASSSGRKPTCPNSATGWRKCSTRSGFSQASGPFRAKGRRRQSTASLGNTSDKAARVVATLLRTAIFRK